MLALFLSLAWGIPSALFLLGVAQVNLTELEFLNSLWGLGTEEE
jgi:hypothetical protein